jgi:hypothetical protein
MRSAERSPPACLGESRIRIAARLAHYCHVFRRGPSQLRDGGAESRDRCGMGPASRITAEASSSVIARLVPFGARQTVKTVDAVYVGSNPTPATSFPKYCWENSRLASGRRTGTQRFAGPLAWGPRPSSASSFARNIQGILVLNRLRTTLVRRARSSDRSRVGVRGIYAGWITAGLNLVENKSKIILTA